MSNLYEASRIRRLACERDHMQKELFTKWINAQLGEQDYWDGPGSPPERMWNNVAQTNRAARAWGFCELHFVRELFEDLRDGRVLLRLLELLSGKCLAKPNQSQMRIHHLENVGQALRFLYSEGAHMENLGAQDIVDGNPRLTLGLIWTIILHFQVQGIEIPEPMDNGEVRHARDALMLWCQLKTAGYPQVEICDFTNSWRDGLAFCALLHRHCPSLIDYDYMVALDNEPWIRVETAFDVAADHLGIPELVEPMDFVSSWWSDERCVLTVVVTWYRWLNECQNVKKVATRLNNVLNQLLTISRMQQRYMVRLHRWLKWKQSAMLMLNSLQQNSTRFSRDEEHGVDPEMAIRMRLQFFTDWCQKEKIEKMSERCQIEFILHKIRISQLAASQNIFRPPEGYRLCDVDRAWSELSETEHICHLATVTELAKQVNIKHVGRRLERKLIIFSNWLEENERILLVAEKADAKAVHSDMTSIESFFNEAAEHVSSTTVPPKLSTQLHRTTASRRKHAAWLADAEAYAQVRLQRLQAMVAELKSNYVCEEIQRCFNQWDSLVKRWSILQRKLNIRSVALKSVEDWLYLLIEFNEIFGHLQGRMKDIHKFAFEQTQMTNLALERLRQDLVNLSRWQNLVRRTCLSQPYQQRYQDSEESNGWLSSKYLREVAMDCLASVDKIRDQLNEELREMSDWNAQKQKAFQLLESLASEIQWIKDQEDTLKIPPINPEDLTLCKETTMLQFHHYRNRQRIMEKEHRLRHGFNEENFSRTSLTGDEPPVILNSFAEKRVSSNEDQDMAPAHEASQMSSLSTESIESESAGEDEAAQINYYLSASDNILSKPTIIQTMRTDFEEVDRSLALAEQSPIISNFRTGFEEDTVCTDDEDIQKDNQERKPSGPVNIMEAKRLRLLIQTTWQSLINIAEDFSKKLWQRHEQLDIIQRLIELSLVIEDRNVWLSQTYESLDLSGMHKRLDQLGFPRKVVGDQPAVSTLDSSKDQLSFSTDHEVVFNSELRKLERAQELFSRFPKKLEQIRLEINGFVPSRPVFYCLEENALQEVCKYLETFCHLENNICIQSNDSSKSLTKPEPHRGRAHSVPADITQVDAPILKRTLKHALTEPQISTPRCVTSSKGNIFEDSSCAQLGNQFKECQPQRPAEHSIKDEVIKFDQSPAAPPSSPWGVNMRLLLDPEIYVLPIALLRHLEEIGRKCDECRRVCSENMRTVEIKRDLMKFVSKITSLESWIDIKQSELSKMYPEIVPHTTGRLRSIGSLGDVKEDFFIAASSELPILAYRFSVFHTEVHSQANEQIQEISQLHQSIVEALKQPFLTKSENLLESLNRTVFRLLSTQDDGEEEEEEEQDFEDDEQQAVVLKPLTCITKPSSPLTSINIKLAEVTEQIFKQWKQLKSMVDARQSRFDLATGIQNYYTMVKQTNDWIINKYEILVSTDELGTDLGSLTKLQRRLMGWEQDLKALEKQIEDIRSEATTLQIRLKQDAPTRRDLYLASGEVQTAQEVKQLKQCVDKNWKDLRLALADRQDKLLVSAELQQFLHGLDDNQLWLRRLQGIIATTEQSWSVDEVKMQLADHQKLKAEIESKKDDFAQLISYGRCITAGETDLHYQELDGRLDRLESGWSELVQMWLHREKLLEEDLAIQVFFQNIRQLEGIISSQEGRMVDCELLQFDPTEVLQTILNKQKDIVSCLEGAREQFDTVCQMAKDLILKRVYAMEKVQKNLFSLQNRYETICHEARRRQKVVEECLTFKKTTQEMDTLHEWLDEKKEVLDELDRQVAPIQAPGPDCQAAYRTYVGRKYSQLRLLESELETNTVRVEQLFKNVTNTIVQYPALSEKLGEQLNKLKSYWDQLKRFMCDRLEKMIQMHRAIIFQDGCIKLEQWLDTCVNSENVQTQGANKVTGAEELASNAGEKTPEGMETWKPLAACASLHEVNLRMKQAKLRLEETKEREKLLEELKEHARMLGYVSTKGSVNMEFIPNLDDLEMRYWLVRHKAEEDYAQLDAQMAYHQLLRDLEDERIWVQEKTVLAGNQDIGRSLMAIHQLICRHRLLIKEVSVRNERSEIMLKKADFIVNQWLTRSSVVEQAEKIKTDGTEVLITRDGVKFKILTKVLQGLSQATHDLRAEILELDEKLKQRSDLLDIGHQCFAHLSEFGELRNWLQETESVIMLESRASRDVATAKAELRKHANVEQRVNGLLASNVREFNAQTAKLLRQTEDQLRTIRDRLDSIRSEKGYKKSKGYLDDSKLKDHRLLKRQLRGQIKQLEKRAQVFQSIQSTIDREYAGLRDVCVEKRQRLEELLSLNIVYEEVYNLENWLHQQNILAAASNTGRNLQECLHLIHRFRTFADSVIGEPVETDICSLDMHAVEYDDDRSFSVSRRVKANPSGGTMRMRRALDMCRCLIRLRHSDAPHIAFWQDRLEEAWTDLNELIRTRMQQLTAAAHRHLYLLRCHEIHELIADKTKQLPKEVGNEFHIIMQQLSQQTVFEQEVHALELQVEWVRTTADNLLPMYAGKWATNLSRPKDKLIALMDSLNEQVRLRREHLQASLNYQKWMIRAKELNSWIDGCGSALEQILQHAHGEDGELLDSVHEINAELIKGQISEALHLHSEIDARTDQLESCIHEGYCLRQALEAELITNLVPEAITRSLTAPTIVINDESSEKDGLTLNSNEQIQGLREKPPQTIVDTTTTAADRAGQASESESHSYSGQDETTMSDSESRRESIQPPDETGVGNQEASSSSTRSSELQYTNPPGQPEEEAPAATSATAGGEVQHRRRRRQSEMVRTNREPVLIEQEKTEDLDWQNSARAMSTEIKSETNEFVRRWYGLQQHWVEIYTRLNLQLSASSFANEADAAEQWLEVHETDLNVLDLGDSVKTTTVLLRRHEALERSLAMQAERFEKLKRPTKLEIERRRSSIVDEEEKDGQPFTMITVPLVPWSLTPEKLRHFMEQYALDEPAELANHGSAGENVPDTESPSNTYSDREEENKQDVTLESFGDELVRKHEWQTFTSRARDRAWYSLYTVFEVTVGKILTYKVKMDYKKEIPTANTFRGETGIPLDSSITQASAATDYTKRPNVFRLHMQNTGARYLFQASTPDMLQKWVDRINGFVPRAKVLTVPTMITLSRPSDEKESTILLMRPEISEDLDIDVQQTDEGEQEKKSTGAQRAKQGSQTYPANPFRSFSARQVLQWIKCRHGSDVGHGPFASSMVRSHTAQVLKTPRITHSLSSYEKGMQATTSRTPSPGLKPFRKSRTSFLCKLKREASKISRGHKSESPDEWEIPDWPAQEDSVTDSEDDIVS